MSNRRAGTGHRSSHRGLVAALAAILTVAALSACFAAAPVNGNAAGPQPARAPGVPSRQDAHGALRQDDVTVQIRAGALLVKATPLDEAVIRLLAPDTYQRLAALADAHRNAAAELTSSPSLFLVSYFSHEPDATFRSEDVQIVQLGRLVRPASVAPVSAGFGTQRLRAQETQSAVYVFDHAIDYDQPFTVRYGSVQSDAWAQVIPRLELERARVRTRG